MDSNSRSPGLQREITGILILIAVMWAVFVVDRFTALESLGLVPRTFGGVIGILAMPLLHLDLGHIFSNTVPLLVLGVLLAGSSSKSASVIASIWLLSGVGLWLGGREALHIGASGIVFGLVAFLIVSGFIERRFVPLAISLIVGFLYGGTLLTGVLPSSSGVSWDGHLFGAIAGAITAFLLKNKPEKSNGWA